MNGQPANFQAGFVEGQVAVVELSDGSFVFNHLPTVYVANAYADVKPGYSLVFPIVRVISKNIQDDLQKNFTKMSLPEARQMLRSITSEFRFDTFGQKFQLASLVINLLFVALLIVNAIMFRKAIIRAIIVNSILLATVLVVVFYQNKLDWNFLTFHILVGVGIMTVQLGLYFQRYKDQKQETLFP